jgi:hypothetical protein
MWLGIVLGGCSEEQGAPDPQVIPLAPVEHLVRASMAVRGTRPTLQELEAVRDDPGALPQLVDEWLESDAFGETIKDLHAELYLIRADTNYQLPVMGPLVDAGYNQADLHHSTVEAPLELVREVVMEDWPYTDILTADYTVANDVVAAIYGLQYDPSGPEWQHTQWVDGRPQSGLLSDSEFWRRHVSNAANFHRGRANFVSRTFLCEDIGARDVFVAGGVDIADEFAVAEAVSTQTGCVGCHNVLDPLAAFFWGYKEQIQRNAVLSAYEMNCEWDWSKGPVPLGNGYYRPEHWCYPLKFFDVAEEGDWEYWGLRPPGFFGEPAETVVELGELIAADPRFAECTARSFAGYFEQVDRSDVSEAHTAELRQVLEQSDFSAKALVKAIVLSEAFATASVQDDPQHSVYGAGLLTVRPEQLARTIEDLTGFRWLAVADEPDCEDNGNDCWGAVNLATSDVYGFRSMMGGIDSWTVTTPTHTPTPTKMLALSKMADEAAGFVVLTDFMSPPAERRLLSSVQEGTTDEALVRAQLSALVWRILGEEAQADGELVSDLYGLWSAATARSEPREGWRVVISALLQDPQLVFY